MLIIFDLDDTLIDTSGTVTPFQLKKVLHILVQSGVIAGDVESHYDELSKINQKLKSSQDSLLHFVLGQGVDLSICQTAARALYSPLPPDFLVPTTPYAKEVLEFFRPISILACVTAGESLFQQEKLKKAGLDTAGFSRIAVSGMKGKGSYYQALAEEFKVPARKVWVCGDRIEVDLVPAYQLGFHTVHMRWGRGLLEETKDWIEYSISSLIELKGIIK